MQTSSLDNLTLSRSIIDPLYLFGIDILVNRLDLMVDFLPSFIMYRLWKISMRQWWVILRPSSLALHFAKLQVTDLFDIRAMMKNCVPSPLKMQR